MAEENTPTPQPGSNAEPTTRNVVSGDKVGGDKVGGDKVMGDKVGGNKVTVVVASAEEAEVVLSSLRWSWPRAWDFTTYRAEKREGFVGREWLFGEVRAWATDPQSEQALLIRADYGVGKSAFLAQLIETGVAGLPLAAEHFCSTEQAATLTAELFVRSLAAQFADAIPAYRRTLEADHAAELRRWLDEANKDPARAFEQAVLAPLAALDPPPQSQLLVVDALDESQDPAAAARPDAPPSIVALLARYARRLPPWLKLLATSRRRPDVLNTLSQAFSLKEINAEESRNLADLRRYALAQCNCSSLLERLQLAQLTPDEVAAFLSSEQQSSGKFLYVARVLNDLSAGRLPLQRRADLEALPPGLEGFYADAFQRRFPTTPAYAPVAAILGVLAEAREPLGRRDLAAILGRSAAEIVSQLAPLRDLLRLRPMAIETDGIPSQEMLHSFDHLSLQQWLTEDDELELLPRAGRFGVDRLSAAARIRTWALAEVEAGRAHNWPYLVRHLASHLNNAERPKVIADLLKQFDWLHTRLHLAGFEALEDDFSTASCCHLLLELKRAIVQASHVLNETRYGWSGHDQLASQLVARLPRDTNHEYYKSLRLAAVEWLHQRGRAVPNPGCLKDSNALYQTFSNTHSVPLSATAIDESRFACGNSDGSIIVRSLLSHEPECVLRGHCGAVNALILWDKCQLVSGSADGRINLWSIPDAQCLQSIILGDISVSAITRISNTEIVVGCNNGKLLVLDLGPGRVAKSLVGHHDAVLSIAALGNNRILSASNDGTLRVWDLSTCSCVSSLDSLCDPMSAVGIVDHNLIVCASILSPLRLCIIDSNSSRDLLDGYDCTIFSIARISDSRVALGRQDGNIDIVDIDRASRIGVMRGHSDVVTFLSMIYGDYIVSGALDATVRIWNHQDADPIDNLENQPESIIALAIMSSGMVISVSERSGDLDSGILRKWSPLDHSNEVYSRDLGSFTSIVSLSNDKVALGSICHNARIYDLNFYGDFVDLGPDSSDALCMAYLPSSRLAIGRHDHKVFIFDLITLECIGAYLGHISSVSAILSLPKGRIATGDQLGDIHIWDSSSQELISKWRGHEGPIKSFSLLDGSTFASSSSDHTIRIWNWTHGEEQLRIRGHVDSVNSLVCMQNGLLASGSSDFSVRIVDLNSVDCALATVFVADTQINSMVAIPDSNYLVAGDSRGRVHWLRLSGCGLEAVQA
jgi:WD40 repeat protein